MKKHENDVFDGYDGGQPPPPEYIEALLKTAPPEVRERAEAYAAQQKKAADGKPVPAAP